ncbi:MAG TPA: transcription repressor NadR [Bacillales bacterium]|nr:transcription repressor NadR [Bacillales bacterium]
MAGEEEKVLGEERRQLLLRLLKQSSKPLTGKEMAQQTNVSRQVIVQDISLLKARNEPIIATARGYLYMNEQEKNTKAVKIIASKHRREQTRDELYLLVDHGVTVKSVTVEHPIYGDLTGSLMLSNRKEVDAFMKQLENTGAPLLLSLTDGVHLHEIEADSEAELESACDALENAGFLLKQS